MRTIAKFLCPFAIALTLATFARAEDQPKTTGNFRAAQTGEIEKAYRAIKFQYGILPEPANLTKGEIK